MGYFKIDKLDKIVIALTFILVTFFCLFNTFCFANSPLILGEGLRYDSETNTVVQNSDAKYFYYYLQKNVEYKINNASNGRLGLAYLPGSPEVNMQGEYITRIDPKSEYTIIPDDNSYLILYGWSNGISNWYDISITSSRNLSGVISDLVNFVGFQNIWKTFNTSIPYISIVVVFALGVWFIKHNIIEHSKGRDF